MYSILSFILPTGRTGANSIANNAPATTVLDTTPSDIWMIAIIIFVVLFVCAIVSAFAISYRPGRTDIATRRIWFWTFAVLTPIANFSYLKFVTVASIWEDLPSKFKALPNFIASLEALQNATLYSTIAIFVAFVVLGFVLAKVAPKTKLGTWF